MHLILSNEQIAQILTTCFCDGGLELLAGCGVFINYSDEDFQEARKALTTPAHEDILTQMVMEKRRVYFEETEEGDIGEEFHLTLEKIIENWKSPEIQDDLNEILNEDYDASPCYRVLQYALYNELKWG
jgi:hypothetical protein